jgi:uncharacterized protein (DUF433 family)
MSTAVLYPHIEVPADGAARLRRLPRIRVAQIAADYVAYGWSTDEMCRQHPYLRPAEAHAAMTYYFDHQDEIDREIRQEWEQSEQDRLQKPRSRFYLRLKSQGGR